MKSKIAERMLAQMPAETKIFIDKYADLVVLINSIMKERGLTQKDLADKMGKQPSEIHKWLHGGHNFTLRSIAKLEAELGQPLLTVVTPKPQCQFEQTGKTVVYRSTVRQAPRSILRNQIEWSTPMVTKMVSSVG